MTQFLWNTVIFVYKGCHNLYRNTMTYIVFLLPITATYYSSNYLRKFLFPFFGKMCFQFLEKWFTIFLKINWKLSKYSKIGKSRWMKPMFQKMMPEMVSIFVWSHFCLWKVLRTWLLPQWRQTWHLGQKWLLTSNSQTS